MTKKYLLVIACCLLVCAIHAQQGYDKEFSFTNENDAYLFNQADAYYTNGIFLKATKAVEGRGLKKTRFIEAGQMIYTPLIRLTQTAKDIDRPYCGYLFIKLGQASFSRGGWDLAIQRGAVNCRGRFFRRRYAELVS